MMEGDLSDSSADTTRAVRQLNLLDLADRCLEVFLSRDCVVSDIVMVDEYIRIRDIFFDIMNRRIARVTWKRIKVE